MASNAAGSHSDIVSDLAMELCQTPLGVAWSIAGGVAGGAAYMQIPAVCAVAYPCFFVLSAITGGIWVGKKLIESYAVSAIPAILIARMAYQLSSPYAVIFSAACAASYLLRAASLSEEQTKTAAPYTSLTDYRPTETFDDVIALGKSKERIEEIVSYLRDPEPFAKLGARLPRGVLLVGPPGTGKTLIAKAFANALSPYTGFIPVTASQLKSKWHAATAENIRRLFKQAALEVTRQEGRIQEDAKGGKVSLEQKGFCIIFIDEIDSFGTREIEGHRTGYAQEHVDTVNEMLTQMDGFTPLNNILVIGATNSVERVDKALVSRFPYRIETHLPTQEERRAIFEVHLKKLPATSNLDLHALAEATQGLSGRDLKHIIDNAVWQAGVFRKESLDQEDLLNSLVEFKSENKEARVLEFMRH